MTSHLYFISFIDLWQLPKFYLGMTTAIKIFTSIHSYKTKFSDLHFINNLKDSFPLGKGI